MLQEHPAQFKDIFQCVYSHVFPKVYTISEKRGFDLKIGTKRIKNFDQFSDSEERELKEWAEKRLLTTVK